MKNIELIYQVNKFTLIINACLLVTIIYGMAFLIVTGVVQLLITVKLYFNYNQLSQNIRKKLNTYSIITLTLFIAMLIKEFILTLDFKVGFYIWLALFIIIPIALAIFHLSITYKLKNELQSNSI